MEKGMRITWLGVETYNEYHGRVVGIHAWGVVASLDNSNITVPVRSNLFIRWGHSDIKAA